ncbi:MAG: serine/threonine protein kinase [Planctomycetes bacterium]|nr:serine/threonine protein kinase [Planctomycetota bacterium]
MTDDADATAPEAAPAAPKKKKKRKHTPVPGYKFLCKIGSGSMGVIYKATQISLDRPVAVKFLFPRLARREGFAERFVKEARIQARLNHPNIVSAYDVGYHDGLYYFVMEYVEGRTVQQLLDRGGSLDERRVLSVGHQIAQALEHAHEHHMVHRDVKPANIMVTKSGAAKLCDLGFAMIRRTAKDEDDGVLGTPTYISPEQARGDKDIDIRSDIYSLGATLYHALVGRPPFAGPDAACVIAKHLSERPVPPIHVNNELRPETSRLVERMLEKRRENRHQTPRELARELEAALKLVSGEAPAAAAPRRLELSVGRRPAAEAGSSRRASDSSVRKPSESSVRKPSESHVRRAAASAAAAAASAPAPEAVDLGGTTLVGPEPRPSVAAAAEPASDSATAAAAASSSSRPAAPRGAAAAQEKPASPAAPAPAAAAPPGARPLRTRSRLRGYVRMARRR